MSNNNNEFDFGFSFEDEESITSSPVFASQNQAVEDKYKAKLKDVENLILPLLYNLKKNPDKAYINWPNRTAVIDKQIEKILAVTRS